MFYWPKATKSSYKEDLDRIEIFIETSLGNITAALFAKECPETVWNFINLAEGRQETPAREGKYYDGLLFHRVIKGQLIYSGCPKGNGYGSPGYRFGNECTAELKHDRAGIMSMVNGGPNQNGSQFMITLAPSHYLDGRNTVFGKVIDGINVIYKIGNTPINDNNRPEEPVILNRVTVNR